jgi:hypothetical protein
MNPCNPNRNPENLARLFSQYVRAIVQFIVWALIGLATIATGYVGVRAILVGVRTVLRALGM